MHHMDKVGQLLPQCGGPERAATQMSPLGGDGAARGQKDIENLWVAISHHESNLRWGQLEDIATHDGDSSDHEAWEAAEAEMAIAPETDDTPSVSAMTQSSDPPPAEGQAHVMEVDDEDGNPPPASPVSPVDDDQLTGGGVVGVEGDLANLTVLSDGSGADTSI